jgi:hypothetical protein
MPVIRIVSRQRHRRPFSVAIGRSGCRAGLAATPTGARERVRGDLSARETADST